MYYVKDTHPAIISRKDFEQAQKLMMERATWIEVLAKQDNRIARTLELEAILDGPIIEFSEDLYTAIIEKIVVKERTCLEFHLKNGLRFEELYPLKRGRDLL